MKLKTIITATILAMAANCSCIVSGDNNTQSNILTTKAVTPAKPTKAIRPFKRLRAQVDTTITLPSANMPSPVKVSVAVPAGYLTSDTTSYPVVFLLNGYGGNNKDYPTRMKLDSLATAYGMIFVCPDGRDSWYWDSPVVKNQRMESFIVNDLVKFADDSLRTISDRDHRAIAGLSMGGHGALFIAMRHSDIFGSAGSMSGGVDITQPKFHNSWKMKKWLGEYKANPKRWAEHTVINLVPTLKPGQLNIIFSCGADDFFYKVNNALDSAMTKHNIPHIYLTTPGYGHSWAYWRMALPPQLDFFKKQFDKAE